MTFPRWCLYRLGVAVDSTGIWWNGEGGTTRLKTWPAGLGDVLGFLFGLAVVYAVAAGWLPWR